MSSRYWHFFCTDFSHLDCSVSINEIIKCLVSDHKKQLWWHFSFSWWYDKFVHGWKVEEKKSYEGMQTEKKFILVVMPWAVVFAFINMYEFIDSYMRKKKKNSFPLTYSAWRLFFISLFFYFWAIFLLVSMKFLFIHLITYSFVLNQTKKKE